MRIHVVIFTIGLVIFMGGIVLAVAIPATVTWKPRSEILASEKTLEVSAGWQSKSEVLADKESLSPSPLWKSKSQSLIDQVITVYSFETYDYWFAFFFKPINEAKNFVISGTATEQSSPPLWFVFYIFDSVNFDLWKAGSTYTSYYQEKVAEGKTSTSFSFSIATKDAVPDTFYFVVEEYIVGVKPVVRVTATISWIEKSYDYRENFWTLGASIFEEAKNIILNGSASEVNNKKFNFYIMDSTDYSNWYDGKTYTAYYEKKNVTSQTFSIPLTKDQATSSIYFAVENPNRDISETVSLSAAMKWIEKASLSDCSNDFTWYGTLIIEESKDFVLKGNASEAASKKFNFYVFDSDNNLNWLLGKSYTAYFEKRNVTSTSFFISLTKEQATSTIYFVAEDPLLDVNETVKFSATMEWNEKATIAATGLGIVLGGVVALFGLITIIIAGIAALVFKPQAPAPTPPTPPT